MLNISVIIPLHEIKDKTLELFDKAVESILVNDENTDNVKLRAKVICPETISETLKKRSKKRYDVLINNGCTDYCSQINEAVKQIDTDYFAILEYDDVFMPKYFKGFYDYYTVNKDVSLFLPINVLVDSETNIREFLNEIVWAKDFSKVRGYIDYDCLQSFNGFNLTGGIFNKNDFIAVGGYKPSIQVAFNYELLLRLVHKLYKVYVVPKEGYVHTLNAVDSLTDIYTKTMTDNDIKGWFNLAKCECAYTEDRCKTPVNHTVNELK